MSLCSQAPRSAGSVGRESYGDLHDGQHPAGNRPGGHFANNAGATLFLSIHFNGNSDQGLNGATVYYDDARAFRVKNAEFGRMVLDNLLLATGAAGYELAGRGVTTDESAVGTGNHFYVLGPTGQKKPRATRMVGALAEGAFVTNAHYAALLAQETLLDTVAQGYASAIIQWFGSAGR